MQSQNYLTFLVAGLIISIASSGKAAKPLALQNQSFKTLQQSFHLSHSGVKKNLPYSLSFIQTHRDKNQVTHRRMQQQYLGFEVYGGYAIIHQRAQTVKMTGLVYLDLEAELAKPSADFIKHTSLALQEFKAQFKAKDRSEGQVKPLIYIDENNRAHWAYRVSVFVDSKNNLPQRPTAIIDEKSFKPYLQWDDIQTARVPVKGMGYGGNIKTTAHLYGRDLPLLDISAEGEGFKNCYMENPGVKIVDMKHERFSPNRAMAFDCGERVGQDIPTFWTGYLADGYDRVNGAYSPANDALYAGYVVQHMYKEWYDEEVLSQNNQAIQLVMRIHYGRNYNNAYWDGYQMTYGDGNATQTYPLVSLEIGAHEISHGFTQQHSGLEYRSQSGSINESFSDMAAKAAEFYSSGKTTWMIGAEILKEGSGLEAIRYMDEPSRDGQSIDSVDNYHEDLEIHRASGIFNRLFYLIATTKGWDTRKAFQVMLKANMDYWRPTSSFAEAGCGVLYAAEDLAYSREDVQSALARVAIHDGNC